MQRTFNLLEISSDEARAFCRDLGFPPNFSSISSRVKDYKIIEEICSPDLKTLLAGLEGVRDLEMVRAEDCAVGISSRRTRQERGLYFAELSRKEHQLSRLNVKFGRFSGNSHIRDYFDFSKEPSGIWVLRRLSIVRGNFGRYTLNISPSVNLDRLDRIYGVYPRV